MLERKINTWQPTATKINDTPNVRNKNNSENKTLKTGAIVSLSAVTLGTLAGIYYFTKRGAGKKLNSKMFADINKTLNEPPQFYESKTDITVTSEDIKTINHKPKWNAVTTSYKNIEKQDSHTPNASENPINLKQNWREKRKDTSAGIRSCKLSALDFLS